MASNQTRQQDTRSSQQLDAWLISKESFLQNASREDRRTFMQCSPAEVQREIERLQKDTTGPVGACLRKLTPFFDGIQSLDSVISPIASLEPHGIGALLWGSVKICLDVSLSMYKESCTTYKNSEWNLDTRHHFTFCRNALCFSAFRCQSTIPFI